MIGTPAGEGVEVTRTADGKIQGRDSGVGNRPARGIMGSPPSDAVDEGDKPDSKPSPALAKAMGAVLGKPTRSPAPGADKVEGEKPARRKPARPAQKPARDQDDELPGGEEGGAPEGPEDEPEEEAKPAPKTSRGADYSRAAEDDEADDGAEASAGGEEEPDGAEDAGAPDPALQEMARRFGITSLDTARKARNTLVEDFRNVVAEVRRSQASPAAQNGQQQGDRPPQASGNPPSSPAHSQQAGPGQRKQLTKDIVEKLHEQFGPEIAPVTEYLQQLTHDFEQVSSESKQLKSLTEQLTAQAQQRVRQETAQTIDRFFASKVKAGFRDRYGSMRDGLSNGQHKSRQELVDAAAAYQYGAANPPPGSSRAPRFISDDDALELAFQDAHKDDIKQRAREQGRREVGDRVVRRHRTLDAVGGAMGGTPKAERASNQLASTIRGFLNTPRR